MRSKKLVRPGVSALAFSGLLTIAVASSALAISWAEPIALTTSAQALSAPALVALDSSRLVAGYREGGRVTIRRSADSGLSWKSRQSLFDTDGRQVALGGRASAVDLAWERGDRIRYARSADYGKTFSSSVALSPLNVHVGSPAVARGANGVVVVAWMQATNVPCCESPWPIKARVSIDGGASFASAKTLGYGWQPAVAIGSGVIYVAYSGMDYERGAPLLRRTLDNGATWKAESKLPRVSLGRGEELNISMTAAGSVAYVAYDVWLEPSDPNYEIFDSWVMYTKTGSAGQTWSAGRNLTAPTSHSENASISLKGGVLRAIFAKEAGVYYKQSADGSSWTAGLKLADNSDPGAVAFAGRVAVTTAVYDEGIDVWLRTATP